LSVTELSDVDLQLAELREAAPRLHRLGAAERAELAEACLLGVDRVVAPWIEAACRAKGVDPGSPLAAEEIMSGPMATIRFLRLLADSLQMVARHGRPLPPGEPYMGLAGRLVVPVFPSRSLLYDPLLFFGLHASVWMREGVTADNLAEHVAGEFRDPNRDPSVCLVLGAGNVSSIAATDMLTKLLQEGRAVLLKMNPVNDHLGPIFEQAFDVLVREGFLRVVYGGAEVGAYATGHESVDNVHITGGGMTHDTIVWGDTTEERSQRQTAGEPLLSKSITSELGNVTPWIVLPGRYTDRQLRFQAASVASSIVNNASFNCVATKMIVTSRQWPQRGQFLDLVRQALARVPPRQAYYPGAHDRFARFISGVSSHSGDNTAYDDGTLPWTLLTDTNPTDHPLLFEEESFVCVTGETALDAPSDEAFIDEATRLANERLWGTLAASITVPGDYRRTPSGEARLQRLLAALNYGTVAINHWSALSFAIMSCPWGGAPGGTLSDPQSGIGWVHNVYMLDAAEKTIFSGPLVVWPKPLWLAGHRTAHRVARQVIDLYVRPAWWKLLPISLLALRG